MLDQLWPSTYVAMNVLVFKCKYDQRGTRLTVPVQLTFRDRVGCLLSHLGHDVLRHTTTQNPTQYGRCKQDRRLSSFKSMASSNSTHATDMGVCLWIWYDDGDAGAVRSRVWLVVVHPAINTKYICEHGASYPRTPPARPPSEESADHKNQLARA